MSVLLVSSAYRGTTYLPSRPPAGVGYLAQALRGNGQETAFRDLALDPSLPVLETRVREGKPGLIGISAMTRCYAGHYELVRRLKRAYPGSRIVLGGPHATLYGAEIFSACPELDLVVAGEGERALVRLAQGESPDKIPGVVGKAGNPLGTRSPEILEDLDRVAWPRYQDFPLERYVTRELPIVSSRGCPCACIFCPVPAASGRKFRARSPESLAEELTHWHGRGYREFDFVDDNFTLRRERVLRFCDLLSAAGLPGWRLKCANGVRADRVDAELLTAMKRAGFHYLAFGVESGDEQVLQGLKKGESLVRVEEAVRLATGLGFTVTLFFLVGSPGEGASEVRASFDLARRYPVSDARFYNLIPYPKTELFDLIRKQGRFLSLPEEYLNHGSGWDEEPVYELPGMPMDERRRLLREGKQIRRAIRYAWWSKRMPGGFLGRLAVRVYLTEWGQELYGGLMKMGWFRRCKNVWMKRR